MRKIIKESIERRDPRSGKPIAVVPLETCLFKNLAQKMREEASPNDRYTLDLAIIEEQMGEEIERAYLLGVTENMMRWIYEGKFEKGGYIQISLISSVKHDYSKRVLTIQVNREIGKYLHSFEGRAELPLYENTDKKV